jgi:hypothetical protein
VPVVGELVLPAEAVEDHEAEVVGVGAGLLRLQPGRPAFGPPAPDRITGLLVHQPQAACEEATGPVVGVDELPAPVRAGAAGIAVVRIEAIGGIGQSLGGVCQHPFLHGGVEHRCRRSSRRRSR